MQNLHLPVGEQGADLTHHQVPVMGRTDVLIQGCVIPVVFDENQVCRVVDTLESLVSKAPNLGQRQDTKPLDMRVHGL